jgi:beta-lactamase regulating signal transducer with metallopeptidase domain
MNLNKISIKSNTLFLAHISFFLAFIIFFVEVFKQIWASCSTILFKVIINNSNFTDIFKQPLEFYIYLIGLIFVIIVLARILFASISLILTIIRTVKYIKSLKFTKIINSKVIVFESNNIEVFTAGFIFPKVYLSTEAMNILSNEEKELLFLHEKVHQNNFDPIRDLIINTIHRIIIFIPFKSYIKNNYRILRELAADESIIKSNKYSAEHIISLIFKIKVKNNGLAISNYTDSLDRIDYIIKKKDYKFSYILFGMIYLSLFIIASINKINAQNTFNHCADPSKCQSILQDQNSSKVFIEVCEVQNFTPASNKSILPIKK